MLILIQRAFRLSVLAGARAVVWWGWALYGCSRSLGPPISPQARRPSFIPMLCSLMHLDIMAYTRDLGTWLKEQRIESSLNHVGVIYSKDERRRQL